MKKIVFLQDVVAETHRYDEGVYLHVKGPTLYIREGTVMYFSSVTPRKTVHGREWIDTPLGEFIGGHIVSLPDGPHGLYSVYDES